MYRSTFNFVFRPACRDRRTSSFASRRGASSAGRRVESNDLTGAGRQTYPGFNPNLAGPWMRFFFSFLGVSVIGLVSGIVIWSQFSISITSETHWISTMTLGVLAGMLCGTIMKFETPLAIGSFFFAFWLGQIVAIGEQLDFGHTWRQFAVSIATINFAPIISSVGILAVDPLQRLLAKLSNQLRAFSQILGLPHRSSQTQNTLQNVFSKSR